MQTEKKSPILWMIVLAAVLVLAAGTVGTVFVMHKKQAKSVEKTAVELADGFGYDTVELGTYPQSRVTDSGLIRELNRQTIQWQSFGYFKEAAKTPSEGTADYMRYADMEYQGVRYRAVTMDFYRDSMFADNPSDDSDAQALQDHGGYRCKTVYWFRCDPLKWRVLDAQTGMLLCERIVDAQPFNNNICQLQSSDSGSMENSSYFTAFTDEKYEHLANDFAASSIRTWLNNDFQNTAFSSEERRKLQMPQLTNECFHTLTGRIGFERMDGMPVQDAVTLLSYADATNPLYNFENGSEDSNPAREALYTDYAVIQGLFLTENSPYGEWMLRTPGYTSSHVCFVGRAPQKGSSFPGFYRNYFHDRDNGSFSIVSPYALVKEENIGIRPVIYCPDLTADKSDPRVSAPADEETTTTAQITEDTDEVSALSETIVPDEDYQIDEDIMGSYEDYTIAEPLTTKKAATTQRVTRAATTTRAWTKRWKPATTTRAVTTTTVTTTATAATAKNAYKLTVSGDKGVANVTGDGYYSAGTTVTVTAIPLLGRTFLRWKSSDSSLLSDGKSESYTFLMPEGDVRLTAMTYVKPKLTVAAGAGVSEVTGGGIYAAGQKVAVKAQVKSGYEFAGWTSDSEGIGSKQNAYSFEMPEHDVKLTATATLKSFHVVIKQGSGVASVSGSGQYKPGDKVTINAVMQQNRTFDKWVGFSVDNPASAKTTFTMPASDVALVAMAKDKEPDATTNS